MSATSALPTSALDAPRRPSTEVPTRPLRRVEIVTTRAQRRVRPRPLYALIAVGGVLAIVIAQLLLSIAVSDGAYRIAGLQNDKATLARTQQSLEEKNAVLASPQCLSDAAAALGMVQGNRATIMNARTGAVSGTPRPASADDEAMSDNLVPNALDAACAGTSAAPTTDSNPGKGSAKDATSTTSTTAASAADASTSTTATGAASTGTTTASGESAGSSTSTSTAQGAPASTGGSADVPSQGSSTEGIPTPQTH